MGDSSPKIGLVRHKLQPPPPGRDPVSAADPGPFGPNNWGLCNAYAHNNDHAHQAPPFAALEAAAEAQDQTVAEWCAVNGQKPGGGNGNGKGGGN